ncbi:MAG: hypothetical protein ACPGSC_11730 [Granulosicoccaceae bacterium]
MSAVAAQNVWRQWRLADRLALLARWQARQSVEVRAGLALLQEQAPGADHQLVSRLSDGRRQMAGTGPLGVVELVADGADQNCAALVVHMVWACALGNAVKLPAGSELLGNAVQSLRELLVSADPVLETLVALKSEHNDSCAYRREISSKPVQIVVTPSADLQLLIKDAQHAARLSGSVLWVNHALHFEVGLRLPNAQAIESSDQLANKLKRGQLCMLACGHVLEQLSTLYNTNAGRLAFYSSDYAEIQAACEIASICGESLAVNTVDLPPFGLYEAQALYRRPSMVVMYE